MGEAIAVVGIACRYPDANSPAELWENVLAQRRAFRRIPPERLLLGDYHSDDRRSPDRTYSTEGAFIRGYEFDRVRFRVAGHTYRSADLAHWLALEVAADALRDAGYEEGEGLPREGTGVFIGNTLTGEFSRANVMRLRWPYVRRVVARALADGPLTPAERREFIDALEQRYKKPFPPIGEESLAGGLSNTIAGRICNHFDFKGGGYTLDGACASSLLAVANACSALACGDVEAALAGGVDLSIDPFELIGFAKAGALAADEMRIYDERSAGFWPGEGCGLVLLMRHADAVARGRRVYAVIRGWGISSDGSGGLTRPEVEGQLLALRRAYARAGYGVETVGYFEGHGTGTNVGDATELQVLSRARREAAAAAAPAVIGSVKANIGHTKAAAGIAGMIKATLALDAQILPPTTGCEEPHRELKGEAPALRVLGRGRPWPAESPLRAGVSAMGFGGINTHVTLEAAPAARRRSLNTRELTLLTSAQDAELFLFAAPHAEGLLGEVGRVLGYAAGLSRSELADLAAALEGRLGSGAARAAVVASNGAELVGRLGTLKDWIEGGVSARLDARAGVFLGAGGGVPRVGFVFPGQGAPLNLGGGAWRRRFQLVDELYERFGNGSDGGPETAVAQPAIVAAELAALCVLERLRITASVAVGHSLGELAALYWGGALDETALLRLARMRGAAMADAAVPPGAMASIGAGQRAVEELINGDRVVIAGINSPAQTVISGEPEGILSVVERARAAGLKSVKLSVKNAFHSPLMEPAVPAVAASLSEMPFRAPQRAVISTVTGAPLAPGSDLRELLRRQVTAPVRFLEAVGVAQREGCDLWLEVGPGRTLHGLLRELGDTPVVSLDAGGPHLRGLLKAAGACFALGVPLDHAELFAGRFTRPFDLDWSPRFFVNPCELAPALADDDEAAPPSAPAEAEPDASGEGGAGPTLDAASSSSTLEFIRRLVAAEAELPPATVKDDSRLLDDLHLNSITVGQLVAKAARHLKLRPPAEPTNYADATIEGLARALDEMSRARDAAPAEEDEGASGPPAGVDAWVRAFGVELVERALAPGQRPAAAGGWALLAAPGHPLAEPLRDAFADLGGGPGVVVLLPPEPDESHLGLLLEGAREVLQEGATRFVLVQHGGGAAAFARTLHLEADSLTTCVVDVPPGDARAVEWVAAEALAADGYVEAHYGADGLRREPMLRPLVTAGGAGELPLAPGDVLVVTGGARGITAECALMLGRETGASLAIFGLKAPEAEAEIASNLERLAAADIRFRYYAVDVTDAEAVRRAVREIEAELGPVAGIVHGAARNVPRAIRTLDAETFRKTLGPKVRGARNLLSAVDPERLRLFVTFGSIIARSGLPGEADYALANEWLTRLTEAWQAEHPRCRCLAIEWSLWSDVGMGHRLGGVEAMRRQGITPIAPAEGTELMRQLLGSPPPATATVVMGRYREMPTLRVEQPRLPFLRFLERPRVYYPQVELVAEAELSPESDPYLQDHTFRGERLLPAILGLEAMAQASSALLGAEEPPVFEEVEFNRPVIVPAEGGLVIRVAALARTPDRVEVVLRSAETNYQVNHFRAVCVARAAAPGGAGRAPSIPAAEAEPPVPLDPARDLYEQILFHEGRFRRLRGYRRLTATECVAEISPAAGESWFGRYLPGRLILGDPGARDAAIHAIQACIPQATILPVGAQRISILAANADGPRFVRAREVRRSENAFVYDMEVTDASGAVLERWDGLRLRAVAGATFDGPWPEGLLGPYVERRVNELVPGSSLTVAVERDAGSERRARSDRALRRALGAEVAVLRRHDGKPEAADGRGVSASHACDLTLAVAGRGALACDAERVSARAPEVWQDLLGRERMELAELIRRELGEDADTAATRVWNVVECLKKAGVGAGAPLALAGPPRGGWLLISSGEFAVCSFVVSMRGAGERLAMAVLSKNDNAGL